MNPATDYPVLVHSLTQENEQLKAEIESLRAEVARLKEVALMAPVEAMTHRIEDIANRGAPKDFAEVREDIENVIEAYESLGLVTHKEAYRGYKYAQNTQARLEHELAKKAGTE